jgi:hypothetical protein
MPRLRTPIWTFGQIKFTTMPSGSVRAGTPFRDIEGQLRPVVATGRTRKAAEHALKEKLTQRVNGQPEPTTSPPSAPSRTWHYVRPRSAEWISS